MLFADKNTLFGEIRPNVIIKDMRRASIQKDVADNSWVEIADIALFNFDSSVFISG